MGAIVADLGGSRALPCRLPPGRPSGRRQPSAATRRLQAAVAVVAVAAVGTLLGAGSLAGAEQASVPSVQPVQPVTAPALPAAVSHVVHPGDTLWSLARRVQPEGDVRPLVSRLRVASGGGALVPGQRIQLAV